MMDSVPGLLLVLVFMRLTVSILVLIAVTAISSDASSPRLSALPVPGSGFAAKVRAVLQILLVPEFVLVLLVGDLRKLFHPIRY